MAVKIPWRQKIMDSTPSEPKILIVTGYDELNEALAEAAYARRMKPEDYAMRAIRAFIEFDLDLNDVLQEPEPLLPDARRAGLAPQRYRGKGFGRWRIERLGE
jgi:hypothetical protein